MNHYIFNLAVFILLVGCEGFKPKENGIVESSSESNKSESALELDTTHFLDTTTVLDSSVLKVTHPTIDTVSFKKFWFRFQQLVKRKEVEEIGNYFEYPIHPLDFFGFQYVYDCDYPAFLEKIDIYPDQYSKQEFTRDFEILFVPPLVKMILSKDASHILAHMDDPVDAGFTFHFFPKEISKKCQRDGNLRFHFKEINGRWKIGVNYCC